MHIECMLHIYVQTPRQTQQNNNPSRSLIFIHEVIFDHNEEYKREDTYSKRNMYICIRQGLDYEKKVRNHIDIGTTILKCPSNMAWSLNMVQFHFTLSLSIHQLRYYTYVFHDSIFGWLMNTFKSLRIHDHGSWFMCKATLSHE